MNVVGQRMHEGDRPGHLYRRIFLALMPLLVNGWSPPFIAIFQLLPIYMLNEYEEH